MRISDFVFRLYPSNINKFFGKNASFQIFRIFIKHQSENFNQNKILNQCIFPAKKNEWQVTTKILLEPDRK